jgi:NADH:ubiquinone oxidoreductase subunit D
MNRVREPTMKVNVDNLEKMGHRIKELREDLQVIRHCLRNDRFESARRATLDLDDKLWKISQALNKED